MCLTSTSDSSLLPPPPPPLPPLDRLYTTTDLLHKYAGVYASMHTQYQIYSRIIIIYALCKYACVKILHHTVCQVSNIVSGFELEGDSIYNITCTCMWSHFPVQIPTYICGVTFQFKSRHTWSHFPVQIPICRVTFQFKSTHVCVHVCVLVCVAPPMVVGAWSMAGALWQLFEYY